MNNRLTKEEAIDQVFSTVELENVVGNPESLSDFLDHVELGVRAFVRVMLQQYAQDEFMRHIGAKPYERTPHRRDRRHAHRKSFAFQ
jgi:transposase-like protein